MKIFKLFPLACAALMMTACGSDNDIEGGATNPGGDAQYLAVNIVNVGTTPTGRALEGSYENGTANESAIRKIRFYFFNSDDTPYILSGTAANWLEVNPGTLNANPTTGNGVEKISDAILVINGVTSAAPAKMVAIANPATVLPTTTFGDAKKSLSDLLNPIVGTTFYTGGDGTAAKEFVMSNSVYASENKTVFANSISGYVKTTQAEAEGAPVNVYVERVAAKVRANLSTDPSAKFEDGASKWGAGKGIKVGECLGHDIYAVIDGWGLADENTQAYINKQITPTWTSTDLGFGSLLWTTADYHRSFWETSVPFVTGGNAVKNYNFNHFTTALGDYMFTLPNTSNAAIATTPAIDKYNNNTRTKFLIAAHLMYKNGSTWTNAEVCTYKGIDYLGVDKLKDLIAFESGYYVEDATSTSPDGHKRITGADIKFVKKTGIDDCLVVAALDDETKTYYKNDGTEATPNWKTVDVATANTALATETAQVRTEGMTYYYMPISHLGSDGSIAKYGIVRNHLYDINVTDMSGFGSPVNDEKDIIIPTVPVENKSYVAAKINVLQWRVVKQDVNLNHK